MLTLRKPQLEAIAEIDLRAFRALLLKSLIDKRPDPARSLPEAYLIKLIDIALSACRTHGYDNQGEALAFSVALLKDDAHPLAAADLAAKAERIVREMRSRNLFQKLQTLRASLAPGEEAEEPQE